MDEFKDSGTYTGEGVPKDDSDLSGMDYPQAEEYVLSFVTTLKQTQKLLEEIEKEKGLWKQRVELAQSQGKADLVSAATKKLDETAAKAATIRAEEIDLARKCSIMVESLKKLKATGVARAIDTDQLLAEFEVLLGNSEEPKLKKMMDEEHANAELEKLKAKMQGENQG